MVYFLPRSIQVWDIMIAIIHFRHRGNPLRLPPSPRHALLSFAGGLSLPVQ